MDHNWISLNRVPWPGYPPLLHLGAVRQSQLLVYHLLAGTGSCWTSALGCIHLCSFAPVIFLMSHNLALINSLKARLGLHCMYSISSSRPAESTSVSSIHLGTVRHGQLLLQHLGLVDTGPHHNLITFAPVI